MTIELDKWALGSGMTIIVIGNHRSMTGQDGIYTRLHLIRHFKSNAMSLYRRANAVHKRYKAMYDTYIMYNTDNDTPPSAQEGQAKIVQKTMNSYLLLCQRLRAAQECP